MIALLCVFRKRIKCTILILLFLINKSNAFCQNAKELLKLIGDGYIDSRTYNEKDTIPIEIDNDWIVLKLKINGKLQQFIWDAGTAYSTINTVEGSGQNIDIGHVEFADAVGVKTTLPLYKLDTVSIGNTILHDITFMLLDTKTVAGGLLNKFSGMLGLDIIDKLNWNFNFDKNTVIISTRPFVIPDGHEVRYANYISYNAIGVNVSLPSGKSFRTLALIDFGLPGSSLYLGKDNLKKLIGLKAEHSYGASGVGISGIGSSQETYTIVDSLNCSYGPSGKNVEIKTKLVIGSQSNRSVLGNKFFRKYNFVRNSVQSLFIFYPRTSLLDISNFASKKTYGIAFNLDSTNGLTVMSISDNQNLKDKKIEINYQV